MLNIKATAIACAVTALVSWYLTAEYKNARHAAIVSEMQIKANHALQEALVKTLEIERQNQQLANDIEVQSAKHKQELQNVETEFRNLIDNAGGLRDPNATDCPAGTKPSATAAKPTGQTPRGNISKNLERLLLSESRRADEAAAYAQTCYNWIIELQDRFKSTK